MGNENALNALEQIATAVLAGDGLRVRSLVQDWLTTRPTLDGLPAPTSSDPQVRSLTAGLAELFAERLQQSPPSWARTIGPAPVPTHLLASALFMKRLRKQCETESPPPLRRRNFYAPANYLEAV